MVEPRLVAELRALVGADGVIDQQEQLRTYASDALTFYQVTPALVVLPTTTAQVQAVVRLCYRERLPFVPRGSGTGLSGGATPTPGSLVLSTTRMRQILELDLPNQRVVVQPGVINLWVTERVASHGYAYAPDPSSQSVSSIGGNVAENAGGAHCLKYGFTVNHVLGLSVVLPDGTLVEMGGPALDPPGYDLPGILVGSEGTLGIVTSVTLRLVRRAEAVRTALAAFTRIEEAGEAVSAIIAAGIVPAAIELLDALSLQACEAAVHAGFPLDAGAVLLVELDGPQAEVRDQHAQIEALCRAAGATLWRPAQTEEERALLWKGRKAWLAALGRISPHAFLQDGVIPRTALVAVLRDIEQLGTQHGLRVANAFHAGDGNLHPLVLYASGQEHEAEHVAGEIVRICVSHGGSITGEHGVGLDKRAYMPLMFTETDQAVHQLIRCAIDPHHLSNPQKIYPAPRLCGEAPGTYRPHPLETAGVIERF